MIDLELNDEHLSGLRKRLQSADFDNDEKYLSMFTNELLYRIFSAGSFKKHGKFYGPFWQNIPKEYRQHLSINEDITVELDFSSFHPRMIHHLSGIGMFGDPYENIGDLDRDRGKKIFNMMINATDEDKAFRAYIKRLQKYDR